MLWLATRFLHLNNTIASLLLMCNKSRVKKRHEQQEVGFLAAFVFSLRSWQRSRWTSNVFMKSAHSFAHASSSTALRALASGVKSLWGGPSLFIFWTCTLQLQEEFRCQIVRSVSDSSCCQPRTSSLVRRWAQQNEFKLRSMTRHARIQLYSCRCWEFKEFRAGVGRNYRSELVPINSHI